LDTSSPGEKEYWVIAEDGDGFTSFVSINYTVVARSVEVGVETKAATEITQEYATLNGRVNPRGVELTECQIEFETGGRWESSYCQPWPESARNPVTVSAAAYDLTPGATYYFRVSSENIVGEHSVGALLKFKTLPRVGLETKPATEIGQSTATFHARVNPRGTPLTECVFEYNSAAEPPGSNSVPCSPTPGAESNPVTVTAHPIGLMPNTLYYYRVEAANAGGWEVGSLASFRTFVAAGVETRAPSGVEQTTATLNGRVNPRGATITACRFEYGSGSSFSSSVPCTPEPGGGTNPVAVSAAVKGLEPGTAYHYRLSVTNAGGTDLGTSTGVRTLK
jgi:phosphodiesterase/alkaline phosphatase D-like protein